MEALEAERQELTVQQTQATSEMQRLRSRIEELKREGMRLQQQLEEAQAPPPPARLNPPSTASDDSAVGGPVVDQLKQDCRWIRGERDVLRQHVNKLWATNEELGRNLQQANIAINLCRAWLSARPGTPTDMDASLLAMVSSVRERPLSGQGKGILSRPHWIPLLVRLHPSCRPP